MRIEHLKERDEVVWIITDEYPPREQSLVQQRYEFGITKRVPVDRYHLTLEELDDMVQAMIVHRNEIRSQL